MKAGGGRRKGNAFENVVANIVVTAFEQFGIKKEDCYRTPSSGGHRYAKDEDPGDLVISRKLQKLFPFHVECKNHRKIELWSLLTNDHSAQFKEWLKQVQVAGRKTQRPPLLVFKGNGRMPILAAYPMLIEKDWCHRPKRNLRFLYRGRLWFIVTLDDLLEKMIEGV